MYDSPDLAKMSSHSPTPTLLTLPHEILSEIIDLVVSSTRTPPDKPEDYVGNERFEDTECIGWFGDQLVARDPNPASYRPMGQGLLLTNRQLRTETLASIDRICPGGSYKLDVMIDNEQRLLPMWTFLPNFSRHVDTVTATMRIFGSAEKRMSMFRGGCGGPPLISWSFYNLLERLLKVGPVGKLPAAFSKLDRVITIRTLEIDALTPRGLSKDVPLLGDDSDLSEEDDPPRRRPVKRPEHLIDFLSYMIGTLCSMESDAAEYGAMLFERVGTVKLKIDGVEKEEYNLGKQLASFPPDGPWRAFSRKKQVDWKAWRRRAVDCRERAGLSLESS